MTEYDDTEPNAETDIAIVGMAARLPGARDVREYASNLRDGIETIRRLSDEELEQAGVRKDLLADPHYVKAAAVLERLDGFDAEFFGFSPKEAAIMDPQHRHFLETAWEALEDAGHPPEAFDGAVGVFAGCGMGSYFMFNLLSNPDLVDSVGMFLLRHTGNDKDFLATRVSYELNLKGPSVGVQTACSTSLVAVHTATQSLLSGECDMALAGGVTIEVPHGRGYLYKEGEILSPDGHCRAFDHRSKGTVFGSGAGVVVLRRLADAIEDGDHIYAVIKGSAVNNDGSGKVGYLAPSVDGQAAAAAEALAVAGVDADTIGYVETHGTGTPVGDPIEIAALTRAFRETSEATGTCAIGSVKTNFGHLDTAAGVASLIKATLSVESAQLFPSLNFEAPNPELRIDTTPFFVNAELAPWSSKGPRRACVNSLGVGGTNAHVVIEEAPERPAPERAERPFELLKLSARTKGALDDACARLADHLRDHPEQELADVAYTLHAGRRAFGQRRVLAVHDREQAITLLSERDPRRVFTHSATGSEAPLVFMLPGGGAQYVNMGRGLYESEPVFREHVDRGLAAYETLTGTDLKALLFVGDAERDAADRELHRPSLQLPAIFVFEVALARLWMSRGIEPTALIGHSMGENTAAHLAGVLPFEDALGLVTLRGQLFERVPEGGMLSVPLPPSELERLLGDQLDLAVVNAPGMCVVSGPKAELDALAERLVGLEIEARPVAISIAAHSRMLAPILDEFRAYLESIALSPPTIPIVSNRTGKWMTDEEATSPAYWVEHLRGTVRFSDGVQTLLAEGGHVFLEVGPGKTLGSLVKQHEGQRNVVTSLRHPEEDVDDPAFFLAALGRLWASGCAVQLDELWEQGEYRRVPLPGYAFQHSPYWIEPGRGAHDQARPDEPDRIAELDDWFFEAAWKEAPPERARNATASWLVFLDGAGVGSRLCERLRERGDEVVVVHEGDAFYQLSEREYVLSPEHGRDGYDALVRDLVATGRVPDRVAHLWSITADESFRPGSSFFHHTQERGFYSLFFLAQALGEEGVRTPLHITVASNGMQRLADEPLPYPEKATLLGPVRVIPRELAGVTTSSVDVSLDAANGSRFRRKVSDKALETLTEELWRELAGEPRNTVAAWRNGRRFEQTVEPSRRFPEADDPTALVRDGGAYLITGGLGGLGLSLADHLARAGRVKLVLLGRTPMPERDAWDVWVSTHGPEDPVRRRIRALRELEELGAEVHVVAADVTDVEEMRRALSTAKERFGTFDGVFHTAGVLRDDLLVAKSQSAVEEVFTPKVHGTVVLHELLANDPPRFVVLFSSTSAFIAPAGQVDYVAANAFLDAFAQSAASSKSPTRVLSVAWGVWTEVGMAADAASRMGRPGEARSDETGEPAKHPLFTSARHEADGTHVFEAELSPETHWVLDGHRTLDGRALVPGTGFIELARAALAEAGETGTFELSDLFFLQPLFVTDGETKRARVRLRTDETGYACDVQSLVRLSEGTLGWRTHAQGRVLLSEAGASPADVDLAGVEARCDARVDESAEGLRTGQEDHLAFGPRWRVLKSARYGTQEGLARLQLPAAYAGELAEYALHPALLDYATGWAMDLIEGYDRSAGLWAPVSYESFRVHAPLTPEIQSHVRCRDCAAEEGFAVFDVTLTDPSGRVLVEIERFSIRHLDGGVLTESEPTPRELEPDGDGTQDATQLSPAQRAFRHNLSLGITPAEGMRALERVLAADARPHVVVSSLPLDELTEQAERLADAPVESGTKFARPQLDSDYVEARDGIETTLVGFWEELLGVDQVGVRDDFFELGGHSLIAVRLFAKIKKAFNVEFAISVLFEAPTVERCAELIRDAGVTADSSDSSADGEGGESSTDKRHRTRWRHLVPMHPSRAADATPFFLVAGMFGNVLNLRHLAHLVGADRPFYGLQARGLYGGETPHETFEEMAADYLAEIRTVQPHGPYLLGGFSGGGITAYEMARQLMADGEEVPLLVLLDTPLPQAEPLSAHEKALIHWQRLTRKGPGYLANWAKNRVQWELGRVTRRFQVRPEHRPSDFHSDEIEAAFRRALDRYSVVRQPLTVTLFRPKLDESHVLGPGRVTNANRELVYPDNGWTPHVERVDVHEVPGDHDSMVLEPNVRVLAARLRRTIEEVEASVRTRRARAS